MTSIKSKNITLLMDELIDVLDKYGTPTGSVASKTQVHQNGFYHNTAHVWFYNYKGEILLQQRSAKKTFFPLLWDVSVAGHVDSGESIRQAAVRETREEIGMFILETDLRKIGVFESFREYKNGFVDNEFHHTFICKMRAGFENLRPHPEEVEALKLVSVSKFNHHIVHIGKDNHFVPGNKSYYKFVLKNIKQTTSQK